MEVLAGAVGHRAPAGGAGQWQGDADGQEDDGEDGREFGEDEAAMGYGSGSPGHGVTPREDAEFSGKGVGDARVCGYGGGPTSGPPKSRPAMPPRVQR